MPCKWREICRNSLIIMIAYAVVEFLFKSAPQAIIDTHSIHYCNALFNFHHSNPNQDSGSATNHEWPTHTPRGREYLDLNVRFLDDATGAVGRGPRTKYCAFWKEYLPKLINATGTVYISNSVHIYRNRK